MAPKVHCSVTHHLVNPVMPYAWTQTHRTQPDRVRRMDRAVWPLASCCQGNSHPSICITWTFNISVNFIIWHVSIVQNTVQEKRIIYKHSHVIYESLLTLRGRGKMLHTVLYRDYAHPNCMLPGAYKRRGHAATVHEQKPNGRRNVTGKVQ